jgi:hypothetical protein
MRRKKPGESMISVTKVRPGSFDIFWTEGKVSGDILAITLGATEQEFTIRD